jgi:hypothetical protein
MISAWDVYWVMQLDAFNGFATFLAILGGALIVLGGFMIGPVSDGEGPLAIRGTQLVRCGLIIMIFFALVSTLLPSSKTAAAMILVPALTSDQVIEPVGKEARELYELAKQALTNVAQKPPAPEPEKK